MLHRRGRLIERVTTSVFFLVLVTTAASAQRPSVTVSEVAKRVMSSAVTIVAKSAEGVEAQGSGIVATRDGLVITNYHVIEGAVEATVTMHDGKTVGVVGVAAADNLADIVILKISARELTQELTPAHLGDSSRLDVGEDVIAIGSPLALEATVSTGVVSSIRSVDGQPVLQTTAPISPGSSGGGLFNRRGEVIGITTFQATSGQNLNFAVPINVVRLLLRSTQKLRTLKEMFPTTVAKEQPKKGADTDSEFNAFFKEALKKYADLPSASERIGFLQRQISNTTDDMKMAPLYELLGDNENELGRHDDALWCYRESLRLYNRAEVRPQSIRRSLCEALFVTSNFAEAADMCRAAASLPKREDEEGENVDRPGARALLGLALNKLNRSDEAITELERAFAEGVSWGWAYRALSKMYTDKGDRVHARDVYSRLVKINPDEARKQFPLGPP